MTRAADALAAGPGEHLDAETLERMLGSLLTLYPQAPVAAMLASGVSVAMPDSVPLLENPILQARSGLDLLLEEDRLTVLAAWDRVLAEGAGRCRVRLAGEAPTPVVLHGFDLRERHQVLLVVFVPPDTADVPAGSSIPGEVVDVPPRFATIRKDERSFIIGTDHSITQILGWSADQLKSHRSLEFIHPDDHSLAVDNWMQMLAHPGPARRVRLRHRRADHGWVWFEVTNHNLLEHSDYQCVVSEMVDISDEMSFQEALGARERLLARIAETIPVGLFQTNADRRITYSNDRLLEILAIDSAPTTLAALATIMDAGRLALEQALETVLDSGLDADIEVEVRAPEGHDLRFCTINLRALRHDDGVVSGAIGCVADVTDGVRMREELKKRATFDELTGCYNRASIMRALEASITSGGEDCDRAVMFVDLDGFKAINDRHGHAVGDELLRNVAARLLAALRRGDLIGRIGGDEFLVVCPDIGSATKAIRLAGRLARAVERESVAGCDTRPGVSVGVAWSRGRATNAEALVAEADNAMYASKKAACGAPRRAVAPPRPPSSADSASRPV